MILEQRKRHLHIWIVLAILVPLLFFIAWSAIPINKVDAYGGQSEFNVSYTINANGGVISLEILNPTDTPGSLVLIGETAESSLEKCKILGQIQGAGTYRFKVSEDMTGSYLLLYSPIKGATYESFKL